MPRFPSGPGVVAFWRALAEVDPHAVALQALKRVTVAIVGRPEVGKESLRRTLLSQGIEQPIDAHPGPTAVPIIEVAPDRQIGTLPAANLYLYVVDGGRELDPADAVLARQIESRGHQLLYVVNKADQLGDPEASRRIAGSIFGVPPGNRLALATAVDPPHLSRELIPKMAVALGDLTVAMARTLPGTRDAVAQQLIVETARSNGQFSLLSALPSIIPVIGTLTSLGADTLMLTKNQALLVFKLAAVHGRTLDSKTQLAAEIAPIVGAAFIWRSIARSLVGLLPGLVSAVPKAGIAFAGTYVVGQSAHYYYRWGHRPRRDTLEQFSRDAVALARRSVTAFR